MSNASYSVVEAYQRSRVATVARATRPKMNTNPTLVRLAVECEPKEMKQ